MHDHRCEFERIWKILKYLKIEVVKSFHALNKNVKRKADRNLLSAEKASRSPNIALSKIKKLTINLRGEDLKLPLATKAFKGLQTLFSSLQCK